jgi:hypothetical protein
MLQVRNEPRTEIGIAKYAAEMHESRNGFSRNMIYELHSEINVYV